VYFCYLVVVLEEEVLEAVNSKGY